MAESQRKRRIPQLRYTENRGIGWHVSFRDPKSGTPKKHRFGMVSKSEANQAYEAWLAAWLQNDQEAAASIRPGQATKAEARQKRAEQAAVRAEVQAELGSLVHVASGLFKYDESRVRKQGEARAPGTIAPRAMLNRKKEVKDFLAFMNERHGRGTASRLHVRDLEMADVEEYNRELVARGLSAASVNGRIQAIKRLVDRSGRPEYGQQVLAWNWASLDRTPGRAAEQRELPTLKQLKALVAAADARGKAMIWMGIGLGFGQSDISNLRVGQVDKKGYDLRRGKTGIQRYGETPPGVWKAIQYYLAETPRPKGALMCDEERETGRTYEVRWCAPVVAAPPREHWRDQRHARRLLYATSSGSHGVRLPRRLFHCGDEAVAWALGEFCDGGSVHEARCARTSTAYRMGEARAPRHEEAARWPPCDSRPCSVTPFANRSARGPVAASGTHHTGGSGKHWALHIAGATRTATQTRTSRSK